MAHPLGRVVRGGCTKIGGKPLDWTGSWVIFLTERVDVDSMMRVMVRALCTARRCAGVVSLRAATAAMCMLVAVAQPSGAEPQTSVIRRFVFDGGFRGSPGLRFEFSRACETVDAAGAPVVADRARFAPERTIACGPSAVEAVRVTPFQTRLLGSGLDHDGVTPMLVLREHQAEVLDVFPMGGAALLEAESTGVGRARTHLTGAWGSRPDILQGAVPGRAYDPEAGVICHGLIVLFCSVSVETAPGAWSADATAFVVSSDRGATWRLHSEDAPVQPGKGRVRSWSMQNWWPMTRGSAPLEAWFSAADYRYRGAAGTDSSGGRVYLFRATRPTVGAPWTLEPTALVIDSSNGLGEHAHASAVVPFGENGMRLVAAFGDGFTFSRIASATRNDRAYGLPGWSVNHSYHGSLASSGFQFVGCAPGPAPGEMLLGADEGSQQIMLLRPDDSASSRASLSWLHGEGFREGPGSRVFLIRTPTPESGGPYAASLHAGLEKHPSDSQRVLYSSNGLEWAEAFAPGHPFEPVLHDGQIYVDSLTSAGGVTRIDVPSTKRLSPLQVGRGGVNRMSAQAYVPLPEDTQNVMRLLSEGERAALDPQPPTTGPVYQIRSLDQGGWLVGRWRLCGAGGMVQPGPFLVRAWVMPNSAESVDLIWRWGDGAAWTWERVLHGIDSVDTWSPIAMTATHTPQSEAPYAPELLFTKSVNSIYDAYVAFDAVTEGTMIPGYALQPGAMSPNEVAGVTGVLASPTWTIALAGQVPSDAWDASTTTPGRWTLASLRSDSLNGVEIVADVNAKKLLARLTRDGAPGGTIEIPDAFYMRGSQVRVCLSGTPTSLEMSATVGMRPVVSASIPAGMLAPPSEIRFTSLDQTSVAPFEWFGGMIDPLNALAGAERVALLRSLSFLDPLVLTPGDANGDGRVDFADLNLVLGAFGQSGVALLADVTGDGRVDFADLNLVLAMFGTGVP